MSDDDNSKVIELQPEKPKSHKTTTVVLHLATPVGWTEKDLGESGRDKLKKSLEVLMNANSPVLTGPGGAILMGMFFRTEAPGDPETIEKMRTEYPLDSFDMDLLEAAYGLLCSVRVHGDERDAPGWAEAFERFKESYHERLSRHLCGCGGGKCDLHPER